MTSCVEPIHVTPRMLPRRWGKSGVTAWCAGAARPDAPVGEIWLMHPHNATSDGHHLGKILADNAPMMLGALGRVPPSIRLLLSEEPTDAIAGDAPISLWRMIEAPLDSVVTTSERPSAPMRQLRARRGDMFRTEAGAALSFGADVTALEVRANFAPSNMATSAQLRRIEQAPDRAARETWFRDAALSVERWTLPEVSFLEPNGETCHVLTALTPGVFVDGQALSRGDTVLLPAEGRRCILTGRGAQVLAAYPDLAPTEIWRPVPSPPPAMLAADPASAMQARDALAEARSSAAPRIAA